MPIRPRSNPILAAAITVAALALASGCRMAEQSSYEAHLSMVVRSTPVVMPDASDGVYLSALPDAPKPDED